MTRVYAPWALALCCILSLASAHAAAATRASETATPPGVRIGLGVRPLAYDVELTVTPRADRFLGKVNLSLELTQPTRLLWLNAEHLEIHRAQIIAGRRTLVGHAREVTGAAGDFVAIRFAEPVPAGHHTLLLEYAGLIDGHGDSGLLRATEGDDAYAVAAAAPTGLRRIVPSFDEPDLRATWKLALVIPASDRAFANAPAAGEELIGGGQKRVRFMPTAPLATYQVGFAVGPFEDVDLGHVGRGSRPLRLVVPKGRSGEARYAARALPRVVSALEDYLNAPLPGDKLDVLALPGNLAVRSGNAPGWIVLPGPTLLARSERDTARFEERFIQASAAEVSGQWFGGALTMAWWDDAWMNAGLTTFMGDKITDLFNPDWLSRLDQDKERVDALRSDRLPGGPDGHGPLTSPAALTALFDPVRGERGAVVLRMFENWIGADAFRLALHQVVTQHGAGALHEDDLVTALVAQAGGREADVRASFHSLFDQPGVAALLVELKCLPGDRAPVLELSQERDLPTVRRQLAAAASLAGGTADERWVLPACFQYGIGADFGEVCSVMRAAHQTLSLPAGEHCPEWVVANSAGGSYLVPYLHEPLPAALEHAPLLPDEAVPVLDDASVKAQSGDVPVDLSLALAARYANDRQPRVTEAAVALVNSLPPAWTSTTEERESLARYLRVTFGPRAQALSWTPHFGEHDVDAFLRESLLPLLADIGADPTLAGQAERLARAWLAGKASLGTMLRPVLMAAARHGSADLYEAYFAALDRIHGDERADLIAGLAAFRDPVLLDRSLGLALSERLDGREARALLDAAGRDPHTAAQTLRFVAAHYDGVTRRWPDDAYTDFATWGSRLCTVEDKHDFDAGFGDRLKRLPDGTTALNWAEQSIDLCVAARSIQEPRLAAFLARVAK